MYKIVTHKEIKDNLNLTDVLEFLNDWHNLMDVDLGIIKIYKDETQIGNYHFFGKYAGKNAIPNIVEIKGYISLPRLSIFGQGRVARTYFNLIMGGRKSFLKDLLDGNKIKILTPDWSIDEIPEEPVKMPIEVIQDKDLLIGEGLDDGLVDIENKDIVHAIDKINESLKQIEDKDYYAIFNETDWVSYSDGYKLELPNLHEVPFLQLTCLKDNEPVEINYTVTTDKITLFSNQPFNGTLLVVKVV